MIDDCLGVDCDGNGQCIDDVNSFTCLCNSGYTGTLCDVNIDDCTGVSCSGNGWCIDCLLYTSPSPRDATLSRMPSSA